MKFNSLNEAIADKKTIQYIEESLDSIRAIRLSVGRCKRSAWDSLSEKGLLKSGALAIEYLKIVSNKSLLSASEREFISSIVSSSIVRRLKDED